MKELEKPGGQGEAEKRESQALNKSPGCGSAWLEGSIPITRLKNFKKHLKFFCKYVIIILLLRYARVAQLVEYDLAKVGVAGSSPVSRSYFLPRKIKGFRNCGGLFFVYIKKLC